MVHDELATFITSSRQAAASYRAVSPCWGGTGDRTSVARWRLRSDHADRSRCAALARVGLGISDSLSPRRRVLTVPRAWIYQLKAGRRLGSACPPRYGQCVEKGKYTPLEAAAGDRVPYAGGAALREPPGRCAREGGLRVLPARPVRFEACAIELWRMSAKEAITVLATRPTRDGGRDVYGTLALGPVGDRSTSRSKPSATAPTAAAESATLAADLAPAPSPVGVLSPPRTSGRRRTARSARTGTRSSSSPAATSPSCSSIPGERPRRP